MKNIDIKNNFENILPVELHEDSEVSTELDSQEKFLNQNNSNQATSVQNQTLDLETTIQGKYLVIDTELTGLHPRENGLIEIGICALDRNLKIIDSWHSDVCPTDGYKIDPVSLRISGFTIERIKKGISYKEMCEKFIDFLHKNFTKKPIVVAQFYPMDYSFLEDVFTQTGYADILAKEILGNRFIDTKAISLAINLKAELENKPIPFVSTSLSYPGGLKDTLNVVGYESHTAIGDVLATIEVLKKLLEYIKVD